MIKEVALLDANFYTLRESFFNNLFKFPQPIIVNIKNCMKFLFDICHLYQLKFKENS
jgi:hypothetical protein